MRHVHRPIRAYILSLLLTVCLSSWALAQEPPQAPGIEWEEWVLSRVVDGDTIEVVHPVDGTEEQVRLICVDTEEKGAYGTSETKPKTAFGVYTAGWAAGWFEPLEGEPAPPTVHLGFETGGERRGIYGRLLAHVWYRDENFNLKLVREGWSPYFNKYGNSRVFHEEFVEAQQEAREQQLGVWDPARQDEGATRPYELLVPWWELRARVIDDFRAYDEEHPDEVLDIRTDLEKIRERCEAGEDLVVFGAVSNVRTVGRNNLWIEFGTPDDERFIVFVPVSTRDLLEESCLDEVTEELGRGYAYFQGTGTMYHDIAEIVFEDPSQISLTWPPGEERTE
jgi:micrococcal nuclease